MPKHKDNVWRDRKRNWLGLPWTFTVYQLGEKTLHIDRGFFTTVEDDVQLYRIIDITFRQTLWQKIIRTGTIHCDSSDKTLGEFDIRNIKKAFEVKELLSELVEKARRENHVYARENMFSGGHDGHDHDGVGDFDHDGIPDDMESDYDDFHNH